MSDCRVTSGTIFTSDTNYAFQNDAEACAVEAKAATGKDHVVEVKDVVVSKSCVPISWLYEQCVSLSVKAYTVHPVGKSNPWINPEITEALIRSMAAQRYHR